MDSETDPNTGNGYYFLFLDLKLKLQGPVYVCLDSECACGVGTWIWQRALVVVLLFYIRSLSRLVRSTFLPPLILQLLAWLAQHLYDRR